MPHMPITDTIAPIQIRFCKKKDIADAQKEVMAEAKGRGYDTKVLRKVVALRKRDANDLAEEEAVLDMYKSALGM